MIIFISLLVSIGSVGIMWIYMCRVSAERNGWHLLAEPYQMTGPFSGNQFGFQSAVFNGFAFTATLNLGVTRDGLFLRGGPLLRLFHPPLLIPWNELTAERLERTFSSGAVLRFSRFPEMSIEIGDKTLSLLSDAIAEDWGVKAPWMDLLPNR